MKLWLDDERDPRKYGAGDYEWVKTAPEAIALLATGQVEYASLDHDLGICRACYDNPDRDAVKQSLIRTPNRASYSSCPHNGTGYDVVRWMEEHNVWPVDGVNVHSANPVGAARMRAAIERAYERRDYASN